MIGTKHKHKHDNEIYLEESFLFTVLCHTYSPTRHRILELEGNAQLRKGGSERISHVCKATQMLSVRTKLKPSDSQVSPLFHGPVILKCLYAKESPIVLFKHASA